MARGGIYDQLGGGFHRYSTDGEWLVPHFEKMLYDQALLVPALLEAEQASAGASAPRALTDAARETCEYVLREMTTDGGAFAAAQDADTDGEEGKFFVWDRAELDDVLGKDDAEFAAALFAVTPGGNWEGNAPSSPARRRATADARSDRGRAAATPRTPRRHPHPPVPRRQSRRQLERPDDRCPRPNRGRAGRTAPVRRRRPRRRRLPARRTLARRHAAPQLEGRAAGGGGVRGGLLRRRGRAVRTLAGPAGAAAAGVRDGAVRGRAGEVRRADAGRPAVPDRRRPARTARPPRRGDRRGDSRRHRVGGVVASDAGPAHRPGGLRGAGLATVVGPLRRDEVAADAGRLGAAGPRPAPRPAHAGGAGRRAGRRGRSCGGRSSARSPRTRS